LSGASIVIFQNGAYSSTFNFTQRYSAIPNGLKVD
jgi:hypothetical protein